MTVGWIIPPCPCIAGILSVIPCSDSQRQRDRVRLSSGRVAPKGWQMCGALKLDYRDHMRPANERQRYNVTSSLISWAHSQNDPWTMTEMITKRLIWFHCVAVMKYYGGLEGLKLCNYATTWLQCNNPNAANIVPIPFRFWQSMACLVSGGSGIMAASPPVWCMGAVYDDRIRGLFPWEADRQYQRTRWFSISL